jgi:hypothetical protein
MRSNPQNPDREAAAARARAARAARASRVRMIRRRVIGGAVSLFVVVWIVIALVLVTGRDPALSTRKAATATLASNNSTKAATHTSGATSTSATGNSTTGTSTTGTSTPSTTVSSVTTRQS